MTFWLDIKAITSYINWNCNASSRKKFQIIDCFRNYQKPESGKNISFYRITSFNTLKNRIPRIWIKPQYRKLTWKLPKYRTKNWPKPHHRKPQCPPLLLQLLQITQLYASVELLRWAWYVNHIGFRDSTDSIALAVALTNWALCLI